MKKTAVTFGIMLTAFSLHSEPKPSVEAIMYVDTEMPCLQYNERLSGRIVIRNNGDNEIKLLSRPNDPGMFICFQLFLFPNISIQEEERMTARPAESPFLRQRIKRHIDSEVNKNVDIVTLKKGDSLEVVFDGIELKIPHSTSNPMLFAAELYLSPDTWIPVETRPSIVVAGGRTYTPVTPTEAGAKWDENATKVYRVPIGTNEVLLVKEKSKYHRLADLQPDDVVAHANKTITITQKNGNVRIIPEKDIARVSAERKEEIRKNRQPETKN